MWQKAVKIILFWAFLTGHVHWISFRCQLGLFGICWTRCSVKFILFWAFLAGHVHRISFRCQLGLFGNCRTRVRWNLFYFGPFWPGTHTELVSGAEKCVMQLLNSVFGEVYFIFMGGFFGQTHLYIFGATSFVGRLLRSVFAENNFTAPHWHAYWTSFWCYSCLFGGCRTSCSVKFNFLFFLVRIPISGVLLFTEFAFVFEPSCDQWT